MDPTGGVVSYVINKLGDLILREAALLANTRQDLEWVQRELRMMQAVLDHVATMEIQDPRIVTWIDEVRKLAFHAEDVVDTFSLHAGTPASRPSFPCCVSRTKPRHEFGTEIAQLRKSVAELPRLRETYGFHIPDSRSDGVVSRTDELLQFRKLTAAPHVEDEDVVGLDRHVSAVVDLLDPGGSRRSVVSIVGMGGLGKTTLAKKVYHNLTRSSSSFNCTAWVCVSQKYSLQDLLRGIARQFLKLSQKAEEKMNQEVLMENLCKFLRSKKYLIVLDDVWTSELWSQLKPVLPDPGNGSRIIITTRNVEVARSANPNMSPYRLSALGEEESRVLFTKKVFPDEENPEQLICTGKLASLRDEIVRKCEGLPLAIIVAGGLLSTRERTLAVWRKVAEKMDWQQTEEGERCMRILGLSYMDLPVHLKWCFLYLAATPEDCEFSAEHLMRLWIAEGFIEEKEGKSSPEETAERHLDELTQRCLIQVLDGRDFFGMPERKCRVHDMVLELAVSEAKKIGFLDVWRSAPEESPAGPLMRRLSFAPDGTEDFTVQLPDSNKLRTLIIMDRENWGGNFLWPKSNIKWHSSLHKDLKLLRVLQLGSCARNLPEGIGHMVNLRYLKLSSHEIQELPSSLRNLRHLQTLDLRGTLVKRLPRSIWRIKTLRHLHGSDGYLTRLQMPKASLPHRDVFKNLRTLSHVSSGPWTETILPCSINLRELHIEVHKDDELPMSRYLRSAINKLQCLNVLSLRVRPRSKVKIGMDDIFSSSDSHEYLRYLSLSGPFVLSSLHGTFPGNLTKVILCGAEINHDTLGLLGNLKHLQSLTLTGVEFLDGEMVFCSGWFPQLHVLGLHQLDINRWEVEEESLPLLSELRIWICPNLEELPEGLQHITTLKELELRGAHSQLVERLRRPQEERPGGDDWYKVQHIQHVVIDLM